MMPREIYDRFVRGYSQKQWGVDPRELSADLARRFDVREDNETRLCRHKYQGIPTRGYARFMEAMLDGIPMVLDCDYLRRKDEFQYRCGLIYTGPIDEFFGFKFGKLKYRGQERRHTYHKDSDFLQPCGQVNFPDPADGDHIRSLEWKHMMAANELAGVRGTVLTKEVTVTPTDPNKYEYPFPDQANAALYKQYRTLAGSTADLLVCGRLGEYRYFDMDQAIARAFVLAEKNFGVRTQETEDNMLQAAGA
jgi:UDP-galactopyranose mutase